MNTASPLRRLAAVAIAIAAVTATTGSTCGCKTGNLKVIKFYDANANGVHDDGEPGLPYWPMTRGTEGSATTTTTATNSSGAVLWTGLAPGGGYWVAEGVPDQANWVQSAPVDGEGNPINPQAGLSVAKGATTTIRFGNYCTAGSGGRTPGFWSNRNGARQLLDEADGAEEELALLRALNLVDSDGNPFNPTTLEQLQSWINGTSATNMAAKLSSHLAAMRLNREAGFVNGSRTYVPFGGTINELMALANASLGSNPYTPPGHPERAYQEQLKDFLDALNNGDATVLTSPCKRTFTAEP